MFQEIPTDNLETCL